MKCHRYLRNQLFFVSMNNIQYTIYNLISSLVHILLEHDGSFSEGFKINEFPHARYDTSSYCWEIKWCDSAHIQVVVLLTKSLYYYQHFEKITFKQMRDPHANSTTSKPLVIEPFASRNVFPCSSDIIFTKASIFFSIMICN